MLHRGLCSLHTLAFLCIGLVGAAQSDPDTRWECAVGGGFLVPHRAVIQHHIDGHAGSVQFTWSRRGQGLWSCSRPAPRWGFSARLNGTGASEALGKQVHLLGITELRVSEGWRCRMGGGLGWTEKPWSAADADGRERVTIGSPINSAIEIGLHRPADPAGNWHERVGIHLTLSHQSNGSFTQPNLGTNVVLAALSTAWSRPHRPTPATSDTMAVLSVLPAPVQGILVYGSLGRRQPAPLENRENVGELGVDWRRGGLRSGAVVGGLMWRRPNTFAAGLHAGFQIRFTRVHIDLVHGRYLARLQDEESGYNRVVFQWHGKAGLWWRLGLHTHGFRAHHPTFGVGWVLSGRSPYGPLNY